MTGEFRMEVRKTGWGERHGPATTDLPITMRLAKPPVRVVAAVLEAGSEKAAAHRLGLSHSTVKHHLANVRLNVGATTTAQLVWILAPRLPDPSRDETDEDNGVPWR